MKNKREKLEKTKKKNQTKHVHDGSDHCCSEDASDGHDCTCCGCEQ